MVRSEHAKEGARANDCESITFIIAEESGRTSSEEQNQTTKAEEAENGKACAWPVAYRWAAMGTLVAYSAIGTKTINIARAQDIPSPHSMNRPADQTQGSQPVRRFDVPAGSLDTVLADFERVSNLTVIVSKKGIGMLLHRACRGFIRPSRRLISCWPARA